MTLIDYFNQFWRFNEVKPLTPCEAQLYFFLLDVWNRGRRSDWFECKTSTIENGLEMNKMTITRCRKNLQDRGLILFKSGKTKGKYPVLHSTYEGLHYSEKVTVSKLKRLKKYLEEEVILWNQ